MISHISIADFAIIDKLAVDFHRGLNMITGETGAGKSIIIEAISLALGSRADTTFIRTGKDKAVIQIVFEEISREAAFFLSENGIDMDEEDASIIITREITSAGKSICRINSQLVSVTTLNRLCKFLADIHGQYDHQSLLNPDNHIHFIDLYGQQTISEKLERVSSCYKKTLDLRHQLASLLKNEKEALRHRDFMEFELHEISSIHPLFGEDEALEQEINILQHGEKIYGNLQQAYELIFEASPSTLTTAKQIADLLQGIEHFSPDILQQKEVVTDCYYRLQEVAADIRKIKDGITFDQGDLDRSISRLDQLDLLKRKYGGTIEKILSYKETLIQQLETIENSDALKISLEKEKNMSEEHLSRACDDLTAARKSAAQKLEQEINNQLAELNFKDARMNISFSKKSPEENGADQVEFIISTNKGEAPKPLAKIASGGEISRIMLAFKTILGDMDSIPTMIFDEIDSGISGVTASIVGKKLLDISSTHQILCITHLPQIAAYGNHNYKIEKNSDEHSTSTTVVPLDAESKIMEIARLTGGIHITEATISNAQELIQSSK